MKLAGWAAILLSCLLMACVRTTDGVPVAGDAALPTPDTDLTEPGVVPTTQTQVPAGAITCPVENPPPVAVMAAVPDPVAPKVTVALPTDWVASKGDGDVGVRLDGPDGTWATVTIAATPLDPAEAFRKYTDDVMATSSVGSVSVLPADLCGYSGQKLLGAWSDSPQQAVEFGDRIAHIWTNTKNYLVAVHVQGPTGTPGFSPDDSPLMDDFTVVIP